MPYKLSKFWQELKRRNVVRVITVYAGAAFVILEAVDIIFPRLGLPDWTVTLVIFLLAIGLVISIILSWIYDIHPEEGIVKTEPADKVEAGELSRSSNSWKIASYISFLVILVMGGILVYPKIFKPDRLKKLRDDEGMISLAVLPFDNLTGDSSLYYWQNGISEYLINRLGNSQELAVSSSQVVSDVLGGTRQVNAASLSPDIARKTAIKIDASTYITGNFIGKENDASIMLNLVNTESGELIWTTSVDGDLEGNYRGVLGHLSDTIRNYMEIKALEQSVETDLSNAYPNSAESYRHYIDGLNAIMDSDYEKAVESLEKAYEIDSTFTFAAFYLAFAYNFGSLSVEEDIRWTKRAYELKDNLPPVYRPWIELWYACVFSEDINDIRRYCNIMFEAALHNRLLLLDLGVTYASVIDDFSKAIPPFEKIEDLNKLWEDDWRYEMYYRYYVWTLLMVDRPDDADRIIEKGLKVLPDGGSMKLLKGSVHLMKGDSIAAKQSEQEVREWVMRNGFGLSREDYFVALMYCGAKDSLTAMGYFRKAWELDPEKMGNITGLIDCQLNCNINLEECLELAEYWLEKEPESGTPMLYMGRCLYKLGRYEEALTYLKEAEEMYTFHVDIMKYLRKTEQALALQEQQ